MEAFWNSILETSRDNQHLTLLLAFLIAGGESVIGLSFFIPSTVIFLSLGAIVAAAGQDTIALWIVASLGAAAGDWISFGLGYHYEHRIKNFWPFSRHGGLLTTGKAYFSRWGIFSIFICRFIGPARSVIMVVAGLFKMPLPVFFLASLASAFVWAGVVLAPAIFGVQWLSS